MKWGLKGGISIDTDSGPVGYVLWCCGSRSQDFFIFIQIGSGHTVYVSDIDVRVKEQPSCEEMPTMILKNGPTGIYGKITKAEQCPAKLWP